MIVPRSPLSARGGLPRRPVGLGLILTLFLPVLALAAVSAVSVRQRAQTRQLLVQERYAAIADLVASRLDEQLETAHRELLAEIDGEEWDSAAVVARLGAAERRLPELRPLVMLAPDGTVVYPSPPREAAADELLAPLDEQPSSPTFGWLLTRAEQVELRTTDFEVATNLYRRALRLAGSDLERVLALNGLGRTRLKAAEPDAARSAYERMVALADPFDRRLAPWAVIGRVQRAVALAGAGAGEEAWDARLEALRFLQRQRFHLDRSLYAFYRARLYAALEQIPNARAAAALAEARREEEELDEIDRVLSDLLGGLPELLAAAAPASGRVVGSTDGVAPRGQSAWTVRRARLPGSAAGIALLSRRTDTGWTLARGWRPSAVRRALARLLAQEGPWRGRGVALLDPNGTVVATASATLPAETAGARIQISALPGWRVLAYPPEGSLAAEARRDVLDYALLLGAALVAVIASVVLASRTVARQVALARARSEFVSSVSHELKTPLSLIRMFAENLVAGWVPEERRTEYYRVMLGESERLSSVIDNVLDFARIEAGGREYRLRPADLVALTREILERYQHALRSDGIRLVEKLPARPLEAEIDPEAFGRVLVNLLSNAVKYIGDGERRVVVSLCRQGERAVLAVADTGVGMDADTARRIFEPFWRSTDPESTVRTGSGLGLTIVRHIARAHGGSVRVDSVPGRGSTFTVEFPLRAEAAEREGTASGRGRQKRAGEAPA